MVRLGLPDDLQHKLLQRDGVTVPTKEHSGLIGKYELTSREIPEVAMQTAEPDSAREATERLLKILNNTYAKAKFKQKANNATHLNAEEITQLLRLLKYFEDSFDGSLVYGDTAPVGLKITSGSKQLNSKYYPVPRINKDNF